MDYKENTCETCSCNSNNGGYCYILHHKHVEPLVSSECKAAYKKTPWFAEIQRLQAQLFQKMEGETKH